MTLRIYSAAVFLTSILLASCAGLPKESKTDIVDRQGVDIVGSPSDQTAVFIKDPKSVERYCSGPGPDFSLTASEGVTLGPGAITPAAPSVGESASRGALDLGGRNPAVLLAREMFYRTCELTMNINASPETTIMLHKLTMEAVERIAATQTGVGVTPLAATAPLVSTGVSVSTQNSNTSATSNNTSTNADSTGSSDTSTDSESSGFSGGSPDQ